MQVLHGRKGAKLRREIVSALNSLFGILAIVSPLLIIATVSLFGEAGNVSNPALLVVGVAIWSYPAVFLLAWFVSRRALARRSLRDFAVPVATLPIVNIIVGLGAVVWYWKGCSHTLLC